MSFLEELHKPDILDCISHLSSDEVFTPPKLVNEILDMSKIEAHAMKIVKSNFWITRAIDEVCNIVSPLAEKKHIKITKVLTKDFEVFADYQKIQQILYNLTSNAIKYTPENGQIDITATINENNFKLVVHDNGIGIDPKYHGKIFSIQKNVCNFC